MTATLTHILTAISFSLVILQVVFNFSKYKYVVWPWTIGISLIAYQTIICRIPSKQTPDFHVMKCRISSLVGIYATYVAYFGSLILYGFLEVVKHYIVAVFVTPAILVFLRIASDKSLLNYNIESLYFAYSRALTYGNIRALGALLVKYSVVTENVDDLIPFIISTCESIGMFASNSTSYNFSTRSTHFIMYSILKAAVFLSLPILEQRLLMM